MSRVAVIGGGYVGLPTAGVLARFGHDVESLCSSRRRWR
jgi:UDP-glucose 6-dehydrogenase